MATTVPVIATAAAPQPISVPDNVYAVSYDSSGDHLLAGGMQGDLTLINTADGKSTARIKVDTLVGSVLLSDDAQSVFLGNSGTAPQTVALNLTSGEIGTRFLPAEPNQTRVSDTTTLRLSDDGSQLFMANTSAGGALIFDTDSGEILKRFSDDAPRSGDCAINDSWTTVVCSKNASTSMSAPADSYARLIAWNVADEKVIADMKVEPMKSAGQIAFAGDSKVAAGDMCMGKQACGLAVIDLDEQKVESMGNAFLGPDDEVKPYSQPSLYTMTVSPDGKRLAAGSEDGMVSVWQLAPLKRLSQDEVLDDSVRALAFSPDGQQIAVGGDSQSLVLIDAP